uniref:Uncharacterized protein n=1 Tax=Arundo donax TaxID=35708 RepID=A0A0A9A1Z8_ARUDO
MGAGYLRLPLRAHCLPRSFLPVILAHPRRRRRQGTSDSLPVRSSLLPCLPLLFD